MEGVADSNESLVGTKVTATLKTSQGDIRITLFPDHAPKTVGNFVGLAEGTKTYSEANARGEKTGPFYDGAIFHRVISGFMLQGGDPTGTGRGGPGYKFADEFHPELQFNKPYLLAMANAGPNTNGSQFFVTVGATTWAGGSNASTTAMAAAMPAPNSLASAAPSSAAITASAWRTVALSGRP